ncbi:hypothetical protein GGF32_002706 [Allomyces javanicus]|nr:hypothetical protein GGF32_002706 [Allomyces javanicus]
MYTKAYTPITVSYNSRDAAYVNRIEEASRAVTNVAPFDRVQFFESADAAMETSRHFVFVDSSLRDTTQYPTPRSFAVDLGSEYRNVTKLRILRGSFPAVASLTAQANVLLDIQELRAIHVPQTNVHATAVLQFMPHVAGDLVNIDVGSCIDMIDSVD